MLHGMFRSSSTSFRTQISPQLILSSRCHSIKQRRRGGKRTHILSRSRRRRFKIIEINLHSPLDLHKRRIHLIVLHTASNQPQAYLHETQKAHVGFSPKRTPPILTAQIYARIHRRTPRSRPSPLRTPKLHRSQLSHSRSRRRRRRSMHSRKFE